MTLISGQKDKPCYIQAREYSALKGNALARRADIIRLYMFLNGRPMRNATHGVFSHITV